MSSSLPIFGRVNERMEPEVNLTVVGKNDARVSTLFLVDTGANLHLTLPSHLIVELGLDHEEDIDAEIGDGHSVLTSIYSGALVECNGMSRNVLVTQQHGRPLIGTELLRGCRVLIDLQPGGTVHIECAAPE